MLNISKVSFFNLKGYLRAARILYLCGRDMSAKYGINHWNNSYFKTLLIIVYCSMKNKLFLVSESGSTVGTFQIRKNKDTMYLYKLATMPQYSGKGIGTGCMQYVENTAKKSGCSRVMLEVYTKSEHAKAFYAARGYRVTGTKNTLKYSEDIMEKAIL